MYLANERGGIEAAIDKKIKHGDDTGYHTKDLATRCDGTYSSFFDWLYRLQSDWALWRQCVSATTEDDDRAKDDRPLPSRIDSGVGIHVPTPIAQESPRLEPSPTYSSILPDPIVLVFLFQDGTHTKRLDYATFARWDDVRGLLKELSKDGITCDELWDVNEGMPVSSGDWNARIQPGCVIEACCFGDDVEQGWFDKSGSDSAGDGDEDESVVLRSGGYATRALQSEHPWWFARWRERVEKETAKSGEATQEPSWLAMIIWCFCMVVIVVVLNVVGT